MADRLNGGGRRRPGSRILRVVFSAGTAPAGLGGTEAGTKHGTGVAVEIDGAGHDLVGVMIEAAAAQEPRCVQHEAAGQILKLRARELRDMGADALSAVSLLLAFVSATQVAFSGRSGTSSSPTAQSVGSST